MKFMVSSETMTVNITGALIVEREQKKGKNERKIGRKGRVSVNLKVQQQCCSGPIGECIGSE